MTTVFRGARARGAALAIATLFTAACVASTTPAAAPAPSAAATANAAPITVSPSSPIKEFGTMWTFDAPPLQYWKARYGFDATPEFLDHLRLSAVRIPGCSASIVSADGLVMTNHHCARSCTTEVSPKDSNYIETGFVAGTAADEKKCRNMVADQLQSIEDVTATIQKAITAATPAEQAAQRSAEIGRVQQACAKETGLQCQVVTLYQGGRYSLYRFKRYTDLRLVMAPEGNIAFYGGDPDNFTYPRYDLDLTLVRIYDNGQPLKASHYLKWSAGGAGEDELVFVVGNPGTTGRLNTLAQMAFLRDVQYPNQLDQLKRQNAVLKELSAKGDADTKKRYQDVIFGYENSIKAITGYRSGLLDSSIMARKAAFERDFRARTNANADSRAKFGGAWDAIAAANAERASFATAARFQAPTGSTVLTLALNLVRVAMEEPKPDSLRYAPFRAPNALAGTKAAIGREIPLDLAQERGFLATQWEAALAALGPDDPFLKAALNGRKPADAVAALYAGTKMTDAAARKALLDGGLTAINASTDPMIILARVLEPLQRAHALRTAALTATLANNAEKLGQAIYAAYGTMLPPDATFTLRITDGVVKGYPMNGTVAPYKTSFYGLYARAAEFDGKEPFALPRSWIAGRDRLDMSTPLDFVSTNDIIGGNSGSPVVNRRGEVVGLIFDGNIESLPNNFIFTDDVARSVAVHSRAIPVALRTIYNAGRIADELEGKKP
ncbi:MAG: S46 family peptidase [Gemmatimonadetes bacterium]|nr:S46 family peptidase [Gemmatimonadota bacterium]